jgi:predicted solute-binding protein
MAYRFAVPDILSALPVYQALRHDEACEVVKDTPANIGLRFMGGEEHFDAALISPLDYARHGGSFRIVPGIGVSVAGPTGVSFIRVRQDATAIATLATDLRSTYDLALTTLLLREKFPAMGGEAVPPKIVPVQDARSIGFEKSDAVLDWQPQPAIEQPEDFSLDLYEEWVDLTELPLVLLLWVVREDVESIPVFNKIAASMQSGLTSIPSIAHEQTEIRSLPETTIHAYLQRHEYGLSEGHVDAVDTLFRLAYTYGMLGDIPDILFLSPAEHTTD